MLSKQELLDLQFIEIRHKLVEVAAFLDRVERHTGEPDFRLAALTDAVQVLSSDQPNKAASILEALSDQSTALPESASFQGATGAPQPITE